MKYIYICHKCKHTYKYNVKWCIQTYWSESERQMIKCTGRCLEGVKGGTNTAVQLAMKHNIPIYNFYLQEDIDKVKSMMEKYE